MSAVLGKIVTSAIGFIVGAVLTAIVAHIKSLIKQKEDHDKEERLVAAGMKWLLRRDILSECDEVLAMTHIDLKVWDNLREENGIYMDLGGNGDVKARMALVEARVRKQEVDQHE